MSLLFDAFGRARVSDTGQRLDVEFLYDKQPDYYDETTSNGTVTHNANARDCTLSLSDANNGSYARMASYPVPYTPGNSQLIEITGVLDLANIGGGTLEIFRRTSTSGSAVEEEILPQSQWAALSGASEVQPSKAHIFVIDFQSLKIGRVRFGFAQHGTLHIVAHMDNDNRRNLGYWQLANGSAYWHLYTSAGITYMEVGYGDSANAVGFRYKITANASATMRAICATVKSEGGRNLRDMGGLPRSINNAGSAKTVSTTLIPLLSIRSKSTFNSKPNLILSIPKAFSLNTDQPIRYALVADPTLTGASWADVNTSFSCVEYDVTASALSGGKVLDSGYIGTAGTAATRTGAGSGLLGKSLLWSRKGSPSGILTIAAIRNSGSDAAVFSQLSWEELR